MKNNVSYCYTGEFKEGTFVSRPNRFIAEVNIDGVIEIAHVKNTGRLPELLVPGARCFVQVSDNPLRKTRYDLITIEYRNNLVNLDSQVPNKLVREAFLSNKISGWENPDKVESEVSIGKSRIDLRVTKGDNILYVEIKGVNLVFDNGTASFPDAITTRGTKHLRELMELKSKGFETMVIFLVQRSDAVDFRPHFEMDPIFSKTLYEAMENGVDIRIYKSEIGIDTITFGNELELLKV